MKLGIIIPIGICGAAVATAWITKSCEATISMILTVYALGQAAELIAKQSRAASANKKIVQIVLGAASKVPPALHPTSPYLRLLGDHEIVGISYGPHARKLRAIIRDGGVRFAFGASNDGATICGVVVIGGPIKGFVDIDDYSAKVLLDRGAEAEAILSATRDYMTDVLGLKEDAAIELVQAKGALRPHQIKLAT